MKDKLEIQLDYIIKILLYIEICLGTNIHCIGVFCPECEKEGLIYKEGHFICKCCGYEL